MICFDRCQPQSDMGMGMRDRDTRWLRHRRVHRPEQADWKQFQQARIEAERTRIRSAHGEIGLAVLDILAQHDPMDIVREANPAEYEPVVRTIVPRLRSARCVEDAQRIVHEEVAHWLADGRTGPASAYIVIGQEVWEAAKRHR
jgi:hypothetical protein